MRYICNIPSYHSICHRTVSRDKSAISSKGQKNRKLQNQIRWNVREFHTIQEVISDVLEATGEGNLEGNYS